MYLWHHGSCILLYSSFSIHSNLQNDNARKNQYENVLVCDDATWMSNTWCKLTQLKISLYLRMIKKHGIKKVSHNIFYPNAIFGARLTPKRLFPLYLCLKQKNNSIYICLLSVWQEIGTSANKNCLAYECVRTMIGRYHEMNNLIRYPDHSRIRI